MLLKMSDFCLFEGGQQPQISSSSTKGGIKGQIPLETTIMIVFYFYIMLAGRPEET